MVTGLFTARVALLVGMGLLLIAYVGGLSVHGDGFDVLVDGWLGISTQWVPAAVCWLAVYRAGPRRWEILLAAAAVTSYASGNTYYVLKLNGNGALPFPSPADGGYLLFYPFMLCALAVSVPRHFRGSATSVWLDSALGSLAAAAILAVPLSPVLRSAVEGSPSLATVVAVAYPMSDLLLVAAIAGIVALNGLRASGRWLLLVAGLLVFAAADVAYALRVVTDTYQIGTPLDAGWAIGLALVAVWVDGATRPVAPAEHPSDNPLALVLPGLATAAALAVLVAGTQTHVSPVAVVFASGTLLAAAARTQMAFRQLVRMSELRKQARTDYLTGLPNRRALYAEVPARLTAAGHGDHALLLLDLDKFKEVNDSLGHHVGDQLLVQVGVRLRHQLRAGDLLSRLGGDEFAILLSNAGKDQAIAVAVTLRAALAKPFTLEGIALQTDVSIGIALSPDHGVDVTSLLRRADMAMYKAKMSRSGHRVYAADDDTHADDRLRTLQELRISLATDQLNLHYQPKVDLDSGEVRGVEALVRWDHPTRGLLYPETFLDLIEDAGLMRAVTLMVLAQALDQAAIWLSQGQPLTVAVNLSASSLVDADLPEQVSALLAARGMPASALQLEITEEFLMADRDRARGILTRLRQLGVQIAVDDFGTGYSSLAYLRDLPIDELKLDRSFIFPMADDARSAALVASVITLAHSLSLRIVAEGVEHERAYIELSRFGCDQAQGYFVCRPVPAAELDHWLATRSAHGSTLAIAAAAARQRRPL